MRLKLAGLICEDMGHLSVMDAFTTLYAVFFLLIRYRVRPKFCFSSEINFIIQFQPVS